MMGTPARMVPSSLLPTSTEDDFPIARTLTRAGDVAAFASACQHFESTGPACSRHGQSDAGVT